MTFLKIAHPRKREVFQEDLSFQTSPYNLD
ncbi:hypothetical protein Zm00014a_001114 [Zea mays]|uniref:Uncharacterized protein n=1 Tax=Zea mays TaxID=4577 RepID=A0A3L6EH27_MAIZE|nr:hypothetical protein Zm00014a_001114 [Zea mays]